VTRPVVIAYDGSADSDAAVREAGRLFAGQQAIVLTVWESNARMAGSARVALPGAVIQEAIATLDAEGEREAQETAEGGAALASDSGLDASAAVAKAAHNVWTTILDEADRSEATVLVVGSRGRSGVKAAILGSVSNALAVHSRQPVLVVRAP
jgi:nucleotide-binding universal stress UspA family protein